MKKINPVFVTVPVTYYQPNNVLIKKDVSFTVSQEHNHFKATPILSKEDRLKTGLPEELEFVYSNYWIVRANNMEEETLDTIKQIILELEVHDTFN